MIETERTERVRAQSIQFWQYPVHSGVMTPEGAERLARRLHRYHLDDSGGPYVEHLARVAELVREWGGGTREVMPAWLHAVPRAGLQPADLLMRGVPSAVIRIIEAVAQDPGELAHRDRDLLAACGLPVPDQLAPSPRPDPEAAPGPRPGTATLLRQLDGDDPNRWEAARMLAEAGELAAVRPLVDAYIAARAGDPRWTDGESRGLWGNSVKGRLWDIIRPRRGSADPAAAQVFAEMAAYQDDFIRGEGIRGLAGSRAHLPLIEEALLDESSWVSGTAAEALPEDRAAAMSDRLAALAQPPGFKWERAQALNKLAAAGDPRIRELLPADLRIIRKSEGDSGLLKLLIDDDHPSVVPALISHLGTGKTPRSSRLASSGRSGPGTRPRASPRRCSRRWRMTVTPKWRSPASGPWEISRTRPRSRPSARQDGYGKSPILWAISGCRS